MVGMQYHYPVHDVRLRLVRYAAVEQIKEVIREAEVGARLRHVLSLARAVYGRHDRGHLSDELHRFA